MSQQSLRSLPALQQALRQLQAEHPRYDAPCLTGVEGLLTRAVGQRPAVQAVLLRRVDALLSAYQQNSQAAENEQTRQAQTLAARRQQLSQRRSGAASALRALQVELNREHRDDTAVVSDGASPISALLRQQELALLGQPSDKQEQQTAPKQFEPPRELRALRKLQSRRRHQNIEQRIEQAIRNAPQDPGPLNPQMLAIRALSHLRDRSPAYLKQWIGYLDTLMWLESQTASDDSGKAKTRKPTRRKSR